MIRSGFTLIEVLVVIAIAAILISLTSVSLVSVQTRSSINSLTDQLLADIRSQQLKSMTGDTEGSGEISAYGLCFQSQNYVLFRGSVYSPTDPSNFSVAIDEPISLSSSFSGSPCPVLVFSPGSGEIAGYTPGADTVTLSGDIPSETKTLQFNPYGVLISPF